MKILLSEWEATVKPRGEKTIAKVFNYPAISYLIEEGIIETTSALKAATMSSLDDSKKASISVLEPELADQTFWAC